MCGDLLFHGYAFCSQVTYKLVSPTLVTEAVTIMHMNTYGIWPNHR